MYDTAIKPSFVCGIPPKISGQIFVQLLFHFPKKYPFYEIPVFKHLFFSPGLHDRWHALINGRLPKLKNWTGNSFAVQSHLIQNYSRYSNGL